MNFYDKNKQHYKILFYPNDPDMLDEVWDQIQRNLDRAYEIEYIISSYCYLKLKMRQYFLTN